MAKGSGSSDEVKIIDVTSSLSKFKVKYLHFDSKVYRRPPYYGTWRKKSRTIRPRNPFGMDEVGALARFCPAFFPTWPASMSRS